MREGSKEKFGNREKKKKKRQIGNFGGVIVRVKWVGKLE